MASFKDKVRGVVLSTAIGDALGAPVEKLSYEEIKEEYGRVDSLEIDWYKANWPSHKRLGRMRGHGIITDDTLMTNALIHVYLKERRHLDAYDVGSEFVKEIAHRPTFVPELGKEALIIDRLFYPEKYIYHRHVLANAEPREAGIGNMINCGAAMYIAPIGVVNAGNPKGAYDEAILFAMGHQASYGVEAAGVLAACVAKALEPNVTVSDIVQTAISLGKDGTKQAIIALTETAKELKLNEEKDMDVIVKEFQKAIRPYSPMGDDVHRKEEKIGIPSNHYTPSRLFSIEELPFALAFIVLNDGDYYSALYDGVSSGRDTDSIGVMIGVILGALYGYSAIKRDDIALIESANDMNLIDKADQFYELALEIISEDLQLLNSRRVFVIED